MRHRIRNTGKTALILAAALATFTCSDSNAPEDIQDISDFLAALTTADGQITASARSGNVPTGTTGPTAAVTGESAIILGGSALRVVTSPTAFNRVFVSIDGVSGYLDLALPNNVTTQALILSLAQEVPDENFTIEYAAAAGSTVGTADNESVSVISVGTGDLQVSVSWNTDADVDLHIVVPGGEEIYYGNRTSDSGGELDLDSNAACSGDNVRNENIRWPGNTAPNGTYVVKVDHWANCGAMSTNFVVRIVNRQSSQTFTGTFTGAGDMGGLGSGTAISTFTR